MGNTGDGTYDNFDQLTSIRNGNDVCYYFTYQQCGRLLSVSVGDPLSSSAPVVLCTNSYAANQNGVYVDEIQKTTYGNHNSVSYTYDEFDRVVALQYEGETEPHYTFSYDNEGCLASQTSYEIETDPMTNESSRVATTVNYQYDLSKRLSRVQCGNYTLTYEYAADNTLTAVKQLVDSAEITQSYVYNRDNLRTKVTSSQGGATFYDYSYDRRDNLFERSLPTVNQKAYGFADTAVYGGNDSPVSDMPSVKLTGNNGTITNENAYRIQSLDETHRYELSLWYRTSYPQSNLAGGTLTARLVCSNNKVQPTVSVDINPDGNWHYVTFLLTADKALYSTSGDFVSPTLSWTGSKGVLVLNGLCFADEQDVVLLPNRLDRDGVVSSGATATDATDNTAPMPAARVRRWTRTGTSSQSIAVGDKTLLTSTPNPGERWEVSFSAKLESGTFGDGFRFRFRAYNEAQTAFVRDASTTVEFASDLIADGQWHPYTGYVTISDDAYGKHNSEIVPYFGWKGSTEAGSVLLNGLTVRKVGDQWNDTEKNFGLTGGDVEEVTVNDAPIAYQKTVKIENTSETVFDDLTAPTFKQSDGATNWTLSFWAKTVNGATMLQFGSTSQSFTTHGEWQYFTQKITGTKLNNAPIQFIVSPQATLYLNGMSLVPGTVALANESDQNSANLKNATIKTTAAKFNTAIEYDTDAAFTAYSRIKHYIIDGEAYSYSYDDAGNISKIQSPDGTFVEYTYDALNQLTAEHHSSPCEDEAEDGGVVTYDTIEYQYDTRGNILAKTYKLGDTVVDTVTYGYSDGLWEDQLVSFEGAAITYDGIGNPKNWVNGEAFTWQHGRQLASYAKDGKTITYTYNSDGIRTSKTVNGVKTEYTVVDGTLRRMTCGDKTLQFLENSVIFNGTQYWYVTNAQSDVIGLIDANGTYVVEYTYDSWGKPLSVSGDLADTLGKLNPFRYRGYIYDEETGLYYVSSRYYDPEIGRWINADNQLSTGDMTGMNLFAYCGNNPVNRIDPTGEAWWHWALGAAVVAVAAVATVVTCGGFAAAATAVCMVGSGVAAATTASTVAAGAFIGSATVYGMAVLSAASTSNSVQEFNDQGNWGTVAATAFGGLTGGFDGYTMSKAQTPTNTPTNTSRGSTGRTEPANLREQLAMEQVKSNPSAGTQLTRITLNDPRWPSSEGWVKMQQIVPTSQGNINIHYVYNQTLKIFDDFKFKP